MHNSIYIANIYIIYENIEQLAVSKISNIKGISFFNFFIKR